MHEADYLNPGYSGPPRPASSHFSAYDDHDHDPNNNEDLGDIPLLQRDSNAFAPSLHVPGVPGGYEESVAPQDDESVNIRYGAIPQRVPRRYKTMKRVE